ncbi:hypothetical protein [Microvirga tunisiensis]|uniref:Uncharacterized protein n=1 Tax=Microvirga tunisiensis TaxID=2108360 RepID=A0A5N7MX68_9HYPH|nr:hypothetical protein [Microvirga tunisiensis]MPR13202.1 hypothetical protein [Microvirga tunisiensis]MPR31099.1 hypothetical protein [Microvirga tunisiensis]
MAAETHLIPAWRLLDREGLHALVDAPRRGLPEGIFLTPNRARREISAVPLVMAARQVIERAAAQGGLPLTAAGALSRADTRALFDLIDWPEYAKNEVLAVNRVLNEADALPVHITRIVLQMAGLLRRRGKMLIAAKKAQALLDPNASADLFALLFEATLWRVSLSYFDRFPVEHWHRTISALCSGVCQRRPTTGWMPTCLLRSALYATSVSTIRSGTFPGLL